MTYAGEDKKVFYEQQRSVINGVPTSDKVIVLCRLQWKIPNKSWSLDGFSSASISHLQSKTVYMECTTFFLQKNWPLVWWGGYGSPELPSGSDSLVGRLVQCLRLRAPWFTLWKRLGNSTKRGASRLRKATDLLFHLIFLFNYFLS